MRQVLVTLFWVWFAVAISIYGFRLYRRLTQGSKAARDARANAATGRTVGLGDQPAGSSRADSTGIAPRPGAPTATTPGGETGGSATGRDGPPPPSPSVADARDLSPTVVQALWGVDLPCDLVPIVDGDGEANATGHRVVFTTKTATVATVAAALSDELGVLGYQVSNAATDVSGDRHRLIATRTGTTLSVAIGVDRSGTVSAEVTT